MRLFLTLIITANVALGSSVGPMDLNDTKLPCDWQCYLDRYGDLAKAFGAHNLVAAKLHWETNGEAEGRNCACEPPAVDKNLHKSVPFTLDMTTLAQRVYDANIKTGDIVPIPMTGNKYKVTQTIADPSEYGKIWFAEFEAAKVCSLVTRGSDDPQTLLLNNLDWATVTIPETDYKVMKGYQSHILAILEHDDNWNKMRNWLASCTARGFTKLFTGHSLGGSVSVWLAIYFETQQPTYHADYIATFGQPRLVQTFGTNKCPKSLQSRTRAVRIVNVDPDMCDAAALVPASNDPKEAHCFESFSLDAHGNLLPKDDQWPNWSYGFGFNVIGWGLHSMKGKYLARMEKVKAKIEASDSCLEEGTHCDAGSGDYWGKGNCSKKCCYGFEYNWARFRHECIAEERPCIEAGGRCDVQAALQPEFKNSCAACCNRDYRWIWWMLRHECK